MDRTEIIAAKKELFRLLHSLPDDYLLSAADVNGDLDMMFNLASDPDIQRIISKGMLKQYKEEV